MNRISQRVFIYLITYVIAFSFVKFCQSTLKL